MVSLIEDSLDERLKMVVKEEGDSFGRRSNTGNSGYAIVVKLIKVEGST